MASSSAVHAHDGGVTEVATEVALTPSSTQTAVRSLNRRVPFILVGFAFFLESAEESESSGSAEDERGRSCESRKGHVADKGG